RREQSVDHVSINEDRTDRSRDVRGTGPLYDTGGDEAREADVDGFGQGNRLGRDKRDDGFRPQGLRVDSNIPFIKIADRVEVNVALRAKRVGGPALVFQQ